MYSEKPILHMRQKAHVPGTLRSVNIDVTGRCNMTCAHCYAETFRNSDLVDEASLKRALDEFYHLGVFHYVLMGGEAMMAPERLEFIMRNCHPDESYLNVVSNGWAMDRRNIRWLKDLKVDKITFSLDSGIREEHDANRLPGSYDRVLRAMREVMDEGLLTGISILVTHESLYSKGFDTALDLVRELKVRMDIQIAEPVGKWDGRKDCLITPEDAAYLERLQGKLGLLPNGQTWLNRDIWRSGQPHCPAGSEFLAMTADGTVLACNFLQFSLGNIRDKSVRQMRDPLLGCEWFDGSKPWCIAGEDHEFIDTYIVANKDKNKPLDAHETFRLPP